MYLVLSQCLFSHVMFPLHLHLHFLGDVRDHQVDQTADEEDHMLRKKDRKILHQITGGT